MQEAPILEGWLGCREQHTLGSQTTEGQHCPALGLPPPGAHGPRVHHLGAAQPDRWPLEEEGQGSWGQLTGSS